MIKLNCSEMHQGFTQKEIRDFLSMGMVKAFAEEHANQKKTCQHSTYDDTFEWAKDDAKEHIKYLKKHIDIISTKQALIKLIKLNGWKEHDVSEDVYNDTGYSMWMNFIGTDDELEDLHHRIYEHDKLDK